MQELGWHRALQSSVASPAAGPTRAQLVQTAALKAVGIIPTALKTDSGSPRERRHRAFLAQFDQSTKARNQGRRPPRQRSRAPTRRRFAGVCTTLIWSKDLAGIKCSDQPSERHRARLHRRGLHSVRMSEKSVQPPFGNGQSIWPLVFVLFASDCDRDLTLRRTQPVGCRIGNDDLASKAFGRGQHPGVPHERK